MRTVSAFGPPMLLLVLALGVGLAGCSEPVPVLHEGLERTRYLRCVLRNDGQNVYSSNYTGVPVGFKPGTEVRITMFSDRRMDLELNKIPHRMLPVGGKFDVGNVDAILGKYFVNTKEELGLERVEPTMRNRIDSGTVAVGMTKAQVYMAMGPPPEVNFGISALNLSLQQLLEANRWEYYSNAFVAFWGFEEVYLFHDEKLSSIQK